MAWTQSQQTAIETRGCGLIVSAAAGSGKTSVLVERLLQILMDPSPEYRVPADRMIVVTFTNDAASEMKARLTQALEQQLQRDPENQWLYQQQMLLQSAHISTISSFCFELIRDNLSENGVTSDFRILNETESSMIAAKAADRVLSEWHVNRKADMQLLWDFFCEKSDLPLEQIVLELHQFLSSVPFRSQWQARVIQLLGSRSGLSIYEQKIRNQLRQLAAEAQELVDEAAEYAENVYESVADNNVLPWVEEDQSCISSVQHQLEQEQMDVAACTAPYDALKAHRGKKQFPRMKKSMTDVQSFEMVKQLRGCYKDRMEQIMTLLHTVVPYAEEDLAHHRQIVPLLLQMEEDLSEQIWQVKLQKNALGFEDGERLALELLAVETSDGNIMPSPLARELSEFYQLIMIDEYQDSNNKQDVIFKLLSHNCIDPNTGTLRYGDNVFLVGDVKQAIYRFRLANPQNFVSAIGTSTKPDSVCRHITLNRNFRSTPSVLHFVNFICGNLMRVSCGEVEYDVEQALNPGSSIGEILPKEQQAVQVAILRQSEDEPPVQQEYVIRKIQKMINDGNAVMEKDGTLRPCRYGDFCILLRNNTQCQKFAHALSDAGIPVQSPEEKGYIHAREISILLDMLRVLDNPLFDTAMAVVMLSPMFWFTAQELLQIRMYAPESSLYLALCQIVKSDTPDQIVAAGIDTAVQEKSRHLLETIRKLRQNAGMMSLEALIRRIYDRTDFLSVMQLTENGDRKRANLQLLLQYVKQYEENADVAHRGLSGFLAYIDWLTESGNDFQQTSLTFGEENAVVVKTMHRSKGLEYPFVFLGSLETRFSIEDKRKNALFSDTGMVGFCLKDPATYTRAKTLPFIVIEEEMQDQSRSEELRLLYVAMTRAKQQLFLPLQFVEKRTKMNFIHSFASMISPNGTLPISLVKSAGCMAHWIWMCLILRYDKDFQTICSLPPKTWDTPAWADQLQICYEDGLIPLEKTESLAPEKRAMANPSIVKEMQRLIQFSCRSEDSIRESQISVSSIQEARSRCAPVWERPKFMQKQDHLTGTERGTAVHAFFQYADFGRAAHNLKQELDRLVQNGFLSAAQAAEVTPEIVEAFLHDPIYNRLQRSHLVLREKKFLVRCGDLCQSDEMAEILGQYHNSDSMIRGCIDMAFEEPNGFVIVDYKTDRIGDPHKLVAHYREQLLLYRAALACMMEKPVSDCYLYSTYLKRSIPVEGRIQCDYDESN